MSKVVVVLLASTVGLGLVSLHLVKQLRDREASVAQLQSQVAELQKQRDAVASAVMSQPVFTVMAQPPSVAEPSKESQKLAPVAQMIPAPPQMPSQEERMRQMREYRERQRQLMQDPEYREAMRLQSRSNFARQYPGVIQELGLDRQQADEFFGLLADQQMRTSERLEGLWELDPAGKLDPADMQERNRKTQQIMSELQRKNEAELAATLGPDKLQAWKEYQSTVGVRYQLEQMRNSLSAQGLALNDDVSKPMLKALAQAQQAEANEMLPGMNQGAVPPAARLAASSSMEGNFMERQIDSTKKRNQRMLDAISPYLTYEQRSAIEKEQQAQLKMLEAQLRLMPQRGAANSVLVEGQAAIAIQQ